jgi:hypothetical protein
MQATSSFGAAITRRLRKWALVFLKVLEVGDAVAELIGLHGTRVKEIIPCAGFDQTKARLVIYAHYNPNYRITPLILEILKTYSEQGFNVVFVTSSKRIAPPDLETAKSICALIIRRRSYGRDFGAWKDGWRIVRRKYKPPLELLLTNDTLLGPVCPVAPMFDRLRNCDADVVGLTDSWDRSYHLQSFFLVFRQPKGIQVADRYLRRLLLRNSREWVITRGEIAMTRIALRHGLKIDALYRYEDLLSCTMQQPDLLAAYVASNPGILEFAVDQAKRFTFAIDDSAASGPSMIKDAPVGTQKHEAVAERSRSARLFSHLRMGTELTERFARENLVAATLNPTHYFWKALITRFRFPFIKADLLALNPSGIAQLEDWKSVVTKEGILDVDIIRGHLKTIDVRRVP